MAPPERNCWLRHRSDDGVNPILPTFLLIVGCKFYKSWHPWTHYFIIDIILAHYQCTCMPSSVLVCCSYSHDDHVPFQVLTATAITCVEQQYCSVCKARRDVGYCWWWNVSVYQCLPVGNSVWLSTLHLALNAGIVGSKTLLARHDSISAITYCSPCLRCTVKSRSVKSISMLVKQCDGFISNC